LSQDSAGQSYYQEELLDRHVRIQEKRAGAINETTRSVYESVQICRRATGYLDYLVSRRHAMNALHSQLSKCTNWHLEARNGFHLQRKIEQSAKVPQVLRDLHFLGRANLSTSPVDDRIANWKASLDLW
jgi:hypothetical protein